MKKRSYILSAIVTGGLMFSGCAMNTVNTTTIKKTTETKRPMLPVPPPMMMVKQQKKKKTKKIVTSTGVPQYGPNIYKSASGSVCANCVKTKYDVTQDKCTDFPVSYRPKRDVIIKDTVIIEE